jgi:hypothetical protein
MKLFYRMRLGGMLNKLHKRQLTEVSAQHMNIIHVSHSVNQYSCFSDLRNVSIHLAGLIDFAAHHGDAPQILCILQGKANKDERSYITINKLTTPNDYNSYQSYRDMLRNSFLVFFCTIRLTSSIPD